MSSVFPLIDLFRTKRAILWGIVSLAALFVFLIVLHAERDDKKDFSISKGNSYMAGLRIINKKDGAESWVVSARKADFSKDETLAVMDAVTIQVKKEGAVLNADSGIYNMNTRDLRLEKNIVIKLKDSTISSESLSWDPSQGALSSDGRVQMQGSRFRIEGTGLSATEDNKVKLMRNVKATFY